MTQKNYWIAPRTKPLYPSVASRNPHQWNCPDLAAQLPLGLPMDHTIRIGGLPVVPGPIAPAPSLGPAGLRRCRADGGPTPSQASEPTQSLGLKGGGGYPPGCGRGGSPRLAFELDDPSDFGPSSPARLHRVALSGLSVSHRGLSDQGLATRGPAQVFADGQRHERGGGGGSTPAAWGKWCGSVWPAA